MSSRICSACGRKLDDSEDFCMECGAPWKAMRSGVLDMSRAQDVNEVASGDPVPDVVHLDSLDGFDFENFCALVFERLAYGDVQIMPYVGDMGRDLIIHTSQGTKIVVECKHHPHGTIGRPVVQKLHSAVVTENAIRGILVTTGKFSAEAIAHAKQISPQIELVDMNMLRDMCDRARIHLVNRGEKSSVFYFPISNGNNVASKALSTMMSRIVSHPSSPRGLFELHASQLMLRPVYRMRYDVHQDFSTSVGIIHSIHVDNQELLLDGTNAEPIDHRLNDFLRLTPSLAGIADSVGDAQRGSFQVDETTLMGKGKQAIAMKHSKKVRYYGRNNVHYTTMCTPGERSIFVRDIKQVFVPEWSISLRALSKGYRISVVEKPGELFFLRNEVLTCRICGKLIAKEMVLCNSCGNMVHKGKSDGYKCKVCEKSICRNCTYWMRRWLFFKSYLCEECALEKQRLQKKTRRLAPEQPQRYCINCGAMIPLDALRCMKCQTDQPESGSRVATSVAYA